MEGEKSALISNMFSSDRHQRKERGATGKQRVSANISCWLLFCSWHIRSPINYFLKMNCSLIKEIHHLWFWLHVLKWMESIEYSAIMLNKNYLLGSITFSKWYNNWNAILLHDSCDTLTSLHSLWGVRMSQHYDK